MCFRGDRLRSIVDVSISRGCLPSVKGLLPSSTALISRPSWLGSRSRASASAKGRMSPRRGSRSPGNATRCRAGHLASRRAKPLLGSFASTDADLGPWARACGCSRPAFRRARAGALPRTAAPGRRPRRSTRLRNGGHLHALYSWKMEPRHGTFGDGQYGAFVISAEMLFGNEFLADDNEVRHARYHLLTLPEMSQTFCYYGFGNS